MSALAAPPGAAAGPSATLPPPAVAAALDRLRRADARRAALTALVLAALLALAVAAGLLTGETRVSPAEVVSALLGHDGPAAFTVTRLRLPRVALALAAGAALGLSGGLLQSVVRNPLASPDVVGVTSGASAAAVLAIGAGATGTAVGGAALVGALVAAALVLALSGRGVLGTRFVVVGVAVSFAASGVLGYALTRANLTQARGAYRWLVGGVSTTAWPEVARVAAVVAAVGLAVAVARRPLGALRLDDDTARGLGARPALVRATAMAGSALLAAVAVAATGPVAFVAFVAGPLGRGLRGRGPALASCTAVGALVVLAADVAAQHLPGSLAAPAGLLTGAVGAPVLLATLVRGGRR